MIPHICAPVALAVCLLAANGIALAANTNYQQRQIELGAASRWDYADIDPVRHHLYLSRGDRVQIIDTASYKPIGEISNTAGVHGIAFAQEPKLDFTSNGAGNSVTAFDLDTMQAKAEIKIPGQNPDAILYEPASQKVFTFNGKSNDVTVIDATIKATGKPEFAVSNHAGKIYFNIEDHPGVEVIDVASNTISLRWKLVACEEPTGIAMDVEHDRIFSSCRNQILAVSDAKTGARIADVPIGTGSDAVIFDSAIKTIYTSNGGGSGSVSVIGQIDADHYTVVDTINTSKGARTMAMDFVTKNIYLPAIIDKTFRVLLLAKTK